jgi:regulator of sigma E protease
MGAFQDLIYTAIFLGVLVTVHEAGHYFAAKWANVKVLKFSIGFGPKLIGFRRGETEYQIAAFPLGGFVQMAGMQPDDDVTEEEASRTYLGAVWWKRVIISVAGPVANLIFPIVALFFVFLGDTTDFTPRVGNVEPGSPAAVSGLRPGDLVLSIDGTQIKTFTELSKIAGASADKELTLVVDREGKQATVIGVPAASPAEAAGLKTFDRVITVDGVGVRTMRELEAALAKAGETTELEVVRFDPKSLGVVSPNVIKVNVTLGQGAGLERIGAERGEAYVWDVRPNTPAASAIASRGSAAPQCTPWAWSKIAWRSPAGAAPTSRGCRAPRSTPAASARSHPRATRSTAWRPPTSACASARPVCR